VSMVTGISLLLLESDQVAIEVCRKIIVMRFPQLLVHTASDADEALELFKAHQHHIVISDVFVAHKNGIEIAREVCGEKPDTIVLFITGDQPLTSQMVAHETRDLCLRRIINKPLDVNDLIQSISEAIAIITAKETS
jgi:DNA-binding NtrC family response regulator